MSLFLTYVFTLSPPIFLSSSIVWFQIFQIFVSQIIICLSLLYFAIEFVILYDLYAQIQTCKNNMLDS